MRFVALKARESAKLAVNAAQIFWQQARIPTFWLKYIITSCVDVLVKMYEKWKLMKKTVPAKRSAAQNQVVGTFVDSLDDLFDIAAADALVMIRIEEDKKFLLMQREKGRPGCMAGVDVVLSKREQRAQERRDKEDARKRKHDEMTHQTGNIAFKLYK